MACSFRDDDNDISIGITTELYKHWMLEVWCILLLLLLMVGTWVDVRVVGNAWCSQRRANNPKLQPKSSPSSRTHYSIIERNRCSTYNLLHTWTILSPTSVLHRFNLDSVLVCERNFELIKTLQHGTDNDTTPTYPQLAANLKATITTRKRLAIYPGRG